MDAEDEDDFDLQLEKLYNRWDAFAPEFHKWFVEVQANSFHTCMIAPVHEKAKLGSPPPRYTTNSNKRVQTLLSRDGWDFLKVLGLASSEFSLITTD